MLVFTRLPEEEIVIGRDIRLKVLEITGSSVKLGLIAPREIPIHRGEVHQAILAQNLASARLALSAASLPLPASRPQVPPSDTDTPLGGAASAVPPRKEGSSTVPGRRRAAPRHH